MPFARILTRTLWLFGLSLASLHCQWTGIGPNAWDPHVGCIDPKEWTYTQEINEHDESTSVEGILFEKPNRALVIAHSPEARYPERAFYASDDEGETWKLLEVDPQTLGMFGPFEELHTPFYLTAPSDELIAYSSVSSYPRLGYAQLNEGIYRSEDGGKSWERRRAIDATTGNEVRIREVLAVDPVDSQRLYATDWPRPGHRWGEGKPSGLYVSDDGGDHVRLLRECEDRVYLLRVNPLRNSELILVVLVRTPMDLFYAIDKSTDGGKTWAPLSIGEIVEQGYSVGGVPHSGAIKDVRYSPWSADTIYVVSTKGLFRSRDGGTSWCMVLIGKGVDYGLTMKRIAFDPNHEGVVYLATWYGLYRSRDDGHTWKKIDVLKRLTKR